MAPQWEQVVDTGEGWAQWCDVALAQGWIARAVALTDPAALAALDSRPYAEQRARVLEAVTALSYVLRALNVPPLSNPDYRTILPRWYGATGSTNEDAQAQRTGKLIAAGGETSRRIREWWVRMPGKSPFTDDYLLCTVIVRAGLLQPSARMFTQCAGEREASPGDDAGLCDFRAPWTGCSTGGVDREGCDPFTWLSWAWQAIPVVGPAAGAACQVNRCLPPLRWVAEWAGDVARAWAARGARGVLSDSRVFVLAQNVRTAERLGMLPADLAALAARLPVDIGAARTTNPTFRAVASGLGVAAAAAAAIPGGQIAGALIGIAAAIAAVLPSAVGFDTDEFGRATPVFEQAWIAGNAGPDGAPHDDIPDPPGWRRSVRVSDVGAMVTPGALLSAVRNGWVAQPTAGAAEPHTPADVRDVVEHHATAPEPTPGADVETTRRQLEAGTQGGAPASPWPWVAAGAAVVGGALLLGSKSRR